MFGMILSGLTIVGILLIRSQADLSGIAARPVQTTRGYGGAITIPDPYLSYGIPPISAAFKKWAMSRSYNCDRIGSGPRTTPQAFVLIIGRQLVSFDTRPGRWQYIRVRATDMDKAEAAVKRLSSDDSNWGKETVDIQEKK